MSENKKDIRKEEILSEAEIERLEILHKSSQRKGRQLTIDIDGGSLKEIDEIRELVGKEAENPEEKYDVYYKGIRKLLTDYLPKGKEVEQMRRLIYDEMNIFLNLGKRKSDGGGIRGSDSRMTFQPLMNEILDVIVEWVASSQNPFELYKELYFLNERSGYLHEEYDESTARVARAMLKLAEEE